MRWRVEMDPRLPLFVDVKWKARNQLERDRDEVRRCLHVRLGHLPSRMMAGVRRLRLYEVRQVTRRKRRRNRRNGEREKAKRKEASDAGAMCGAEHGPPCNKNSASPEGGAIFVEKVFFTRKSVDVALFTRGDCFGRFCFTIASCRHSRRITTLSLCPSHDDRGRSKRAGGGIAFRIPSFVCRCDCYPANLSDARWSRWLPELRIHA